MTDLILLNYNDSESCLNFLNRHKCCKSIDHFIVVDNNSSDDSFRILESVSDEKVIVVKTDKNGGYASGNNYGVAYAKEHFNSDYIVISNPDVLFNEDCVLKCISVLESDEDSIICAPRMKDLNGLNQPCAWNLATWFRYAWETLPFTKKKKTLKNGDYDGLEYVKCDCVAGSFFVVNLKRLQRDFLFDPSTFLYCEETILGFLNGNNKAVSLSNAFFIHAHSQTISREFKSSFSREKLIWKSKWYVFDNYYKIGFLKKIVVSAIKTLNLAAVAIRSLFRRKN